MEAVREITVWSGVDYRQPNHDYLLDGDRVVAYRPWGTGEIIQCSGKLKIDRRGRKFEKLVPNPFEVTKPKDPVVLEVPGSKGNIYFVNTEDNTCTCPGFTFRGSCKHTKELELEDY
jgi:hypothetical protein